MIRAVIDTNVLVSGLIAAAGNEALILLAIHQGLVQPCFSAAILEEYVDVLARPKFGFVVNDIDALLEMFRRNGELIHPEGPAPTLPDPDDAQFLHCAQMAGAEFVITGNNRHFPQDACDPIRVITAGELLDRITREI